MENTITQQLDKKDMEYVDVLKKLGYDMCVAKVIVALIPNGKTQKELSVCISENQSGVSVALKKLSKENLINISERIQDGGKGRPCMVYTLIPWVTIVDKLERKAIREIEKTTEQIKMLKTLADNN